MDEPEDFTNWVVDYQKVSKNKNFLAVTRMLASQAMNNPYITLQQFFTDLSDGDLDILLEVADEEDDSRHFQELILMTEMLSRCEGLVTKDSEQLTGRVNAFMMLLACEGLYRKGLVDVIRENYSFGDDMAEAIVVKQKQ